MSRIFEGEPAQLMFVSLYVNTYLRMDNITNRANKVECQLIRDLVHASDWAKTKIKEDSQNSLEWGTLIVAAKHRIRDIIDKSPYKIDIAIQANKIFERAIELLKGEGIKIVESGTHIDTINVERITDGDLFRINKILDKEFGEPFILYITP